jgi:hypothetical protein
MIGTNQVAKAPAITFGGLTSLLPLSNEATKEELFERAKAAVEAGQQSMREAAEALNTAQELHKVTQAEMARAVGKSEAWVSYLLRWRRSGYREESPFGPTTKMARLQHAEHRSATSQAKPRKRNTDNANDDVAADGAVTSDGTAAHEPPARPDDVVNSSRTGVHPPDDALLDFSARLMDLKRRIGKFAPGRFADTSVPADDLAAVGEYILELAQIKRRIERHSRGVESAAPKPADDLAMRRDLVHEPCDGAA